MKGFNRIFAAVLILMFVVFIGANLGLSRLSESDGRPYRVEAKRAAEEITEKGFENVDFSKYPSIVKVICMEDKDVFGFLTGEEHDYLVKEIDGSYYRFDYMTNHMDYRSHAVKSVNISLGIMAAVLLFVLFYLREKLVKPFQKLGNLPYEIAKGNLSLPLTENKNRFFGHFVWGMNILRENLEQQKAAELKLQREKKTLVLSLSHEIKTPLSAIKLYTKALSKNLYENAMKKAEIFDCINARADEIEDFISQIIRANNEEFLNLSVPEGEFYLSELAERIRAYYAEKLSLIKTDFAMGDFSDCILKGDSDCSVEALQNIIENAIKYGDGHSIRIDFSDEEDCRLITVKNSGCTLSENELPHIFGSFWRGSNAGSCAGSGLGLYICRQLMHKMDGEIFARCQNGTMSVTAVFRRV